MLRELLNDFSYEGLQRWHSSEQVALFCNAMHTFTYLLFSYFIIYAPLEKKISFLESSDKLKYDLQLSEHLEHFLPLKRPKNTSFFTFSASFSGLALHSEQFGEFGFLDRL